MKAPVAPELEATLIFLTRCVPIVEVKSIVKRLRDMSATLSELHMPIQPNSEVESTIISGGQSQEPGLVTGSIMPNA